MDEKMLDMTDLNSREYYNNRELSWLSFNKRVLEEAMDERNPLLERAKFLAIFSSNLDEFFMVRVAGLKDQVKAGFKNPENKAGLTPKEQLSSISKKTSALIDLQYATYQQVLHELQREKVRILPIGELHRDQLAFLETLFDELICPVLTPLAVDAYHPFPMLRNKSINLAVVLQKAGDQQDAAKLAMVQVPSGLERFIRLPEDQPRCYQFVLLEDIISYFIYKIFMGYEVKSVTPFRITRNADLTIHEEDAEDLLKEIEEELKMRKWGAAVRLEVQNKQADRQIVKFLSRVLEIHKKDVYLIDGPLDLTFLFRFYEQMGKWLEHLTYSPLIPQYPGEVQSAGSIFDVLAERDILLHHPYDSFEPVIEFVMEAAKDPDVLAIKQTLYRVSKDSPIIQALKTAAENGKQVLVLVELKARFDEEHNVHWAKELEKAGCHVIYGVNKLKTHSKITLVVRRNQGNIQRFVHLGTGNYNDATAKIYTDLGLMTSHPEFGRDATLFFNYLSGYSVKPLFRHLTISPYDIRDQLMDLIDREIEFQQQYGKGRMIAQMNSITDKKLIIKLYEASRAGVKIDLIVRGICCLRPGIPGVSENIRVRSIVGRFLEHRRIYYFYHNGEEKIYLSSADWMTRNMIRRVEISFPVYDPSLKEKIKQILHLTLSDNVKAREQNAKGEYHYVQRDPDQPEIDSQMTLFRMAYEDKVKEVQR